VGEKNNNTKFTSVTMPFGGNTETIIIN